jgi:Cu/Ag efflux protein CusF
VTPETRTGKARIELANPGGQLKPAMYASVELAAGGARKVLAVPSSAVIDSGVRQMVLVQLAEGRFEPRQVKLGGRADDYVEIAQGVKAGEAVVVTANFLIDAESNLKAALTGLTSPSPSTPAQASNAQPTSVGHKAEGTLDDIDPKKDSVGITHGPVPTLKWPAMSMRFNLANPSLATGLKPGAAVAFEFVERQPGEYVITSITPKTTAKPAAGHAGH